LQVYSETGTKNCDEALNTHFGGFLGALGRGVQVGDGAISSALPVTAHA